MFRQQGPYQKAVVEEVVRHCGRRCIELARSVREEGVAGVHDLGVALWQSAVGVAAGYDTAAVALAAVRRTGSVSGGSRSNSAR